MQKFWVEIRTVIIAFLVIMFSYSKVYAYNSIMEFESHSTTEAFFGYIAGLNWCFDNVNLDPIQMNNIEIPIYIAPNSIPNVSSGSVGSIAEVGSIVQLIAALTSALVTVVAAIAISEALAIAIVFGALATLMVDLEICTNTYIVQPWEYISRSLGGEYWDCQSSSNGYFNAGAKAITSIDVPFYYSCDPTYNTTPNQIQGSIEEEEMVGLYWGYMGTASQYCVGNGLQYAHPELVGKVLVEKTEGWGGRFFYGDYGRCGTSNRSSAWMAAGEWSLINGIQYYAYYNFGSSGDVQICVSVPVLTAGYPGGYSGSATYANLDVGCSYVAPPNTSFSNPELLALVGDTRCYYFFGGRTDLNSLGQALPKVDVNGHNGMAIIGFLESELHITSTMIGCVNDMLVQTFFGANVNGGQGFFILVQENLAPIVYAALTLYVALIGIRIMASPQVPTYGDFMMFILKFMLVVYFMKGSAWYYIDNNEIRGLFYSLIWAPDEIGSWFISAVNGNDPIGYCRYDLNGQELFDYASIDPASIGSGVKPTIGHSTVQINLWDLMDCKFSNYINFGSCNYSISGMVGMWMVSAALLVGGSGVLLTVSTFIYTWLLLLVFFKFAHIFILSSLVTALLVLLSPIFLCFALFESTKSIFEVWFKLVIGYMLYPALLIAFVALMLMTLDSIYYGFTPRTLATTGQLITFDDALAECRNITSVFCTTINQINANPCEMNLGQVANKIASSQSFGPLGSFTTLNSTSAANYSGAVLNLMVFSLIFYFFLGSVTNLMSVLTGVQNLDSSSKGAIDLMAVLQSVVGKVAGKSSGMMGGMMGSMTKMMDFGKKGGGGDDPMGGMMGGGGGGGGGGMMGGMMGGGGGGGGGMMGGMMGGGGGGGGGGMMGGMMGGGGGGGGGMMGGMMGGGGGS